MESVLELPTLVLNKKWCAINTMSVRDALSLVYQKSAKIIEPETFETHTFESWADLVPPKGSNIIHTPRFALMAPEIISVLNYASVPQRRTLFSRMNIYKRDNFTCQYCEAKPGTRELSIDHIIPTSRGGKSTWLNCVLACTPCNRRKSAKTLKQANMRLLREPFEPPWNPTFTFKLHPKPRSWQKFISEKYWETELVN